MRGPEGGFYSALDADSEGEEGKFYVWTEDELRDAARRRRATPLLALLGRRPRPELRGPQHPARRRRRRSTPSCSSARARKLYEVARAARLAGARRQAPDRLERADDRRARRRGRGARARRLRRRGARVRRASCSSEMRDADGRLLRTYKDGRASLNAYLEDHAFLVEALLVLYEATFETRWFVEARALADTIVSSASATPRAAASSRPPRDHEELVVRPQGLRGPPDPVRQLVRRIRRCCGSPPSPATAPTSSRARRGVPAPAPGRRRAIRRRSGTCSRRCTSTSRRRARSRSSASRSTRSRASCARGSAPRSCWPAMRPGDEEALDAIPLLRGREPVDGRAGRLRLRELHLPAAGHRAGRARASCSHDGAPAAAAGRLALGDLEVSRIGFGAPLSSRTPSDCAAAAAHERSSSA